jgi:hypothetical protein
MFAGQTHSAYSPSIAPAHHRVAGANSPTPPAISQAPVTSTTARGKGMPGGTIAVNPPGAARCRTPNAM